MKTRTLALALLGFLAGPAGASPSLIPLERAPVTGRVTTLRLADEGEPVQGLRLTAVYRENAHAALRSEQALGVTDAAGTIRWTPEAAGVVVLRWEEGSANVSVAHDGIPVGGVLIAILAGIGLLGGSVLFFVQMLRQEDPEIIEEVEAIGEPPST